MVASTATTGNEPWVSDGTAAGTTLTRDLVSSPAPKNLVGLNGALYFAASTGSEYRLHRSDGTPAGTFVLHHGVGPRDVANLTAAGGAVWSGTPER